MPETKSKILLIDDDPSIAETYKLGLGLEGYEIDWAKNGLEGIKKAKEGSYSLILLDILMPELSGLNALEQMKKDEKIKDIPVIILTNLGQDENIKRAFDLGAVDYIIKYRFTPKEVVEKIKQTLQ